jgi:hypothetical protein
VPVNNFICQRRSCQREFTADFDASAGSPFCPHCGGKPCKWMPCAVNVGKVAKGIDSTMNDLVKDHNERVAEYPHLKISNLRCERGLPAIRPPPPPKGEPTPLPLNTPFGPITANVPLNSGRLMCSTLVNAALSDAARVKLKANEDGRPATPMTSLGGTDYPMPLPPRPNVVHRF